RRGLDLTDGVAITSSFHPDEHTHVEPVRYGRGSKSMGLLQTRLAAGGARAARRRRVAAPRHGPPNPGWIPAGNQTVRLLAEEINGVAGGSITEVFDTPVPAPILGGAVIGAGPEHGVVDPYHRVFGHPGLHVVDGAAVCANLGVNPSLTIAAQAERALACWPNRGEPDPRPPLGAGYVRVAPVRPHHPAVPRSAPAALWPDRPERLGAARGS